MIYVGVAPKLPVMSMNKVACKMAARLDDGMTRYHMMYAGSAIVSMAEGYAKRVFF